MNLYWYRTYAHNDRLKYDGLITKKHFRDVLILNGTPHSFRFFLTFYEPDYVYYVLCVVVFTENKDKYGWKRHRV